MEVIWIKAIDIEYGLADNNEDFKPYVQYGENIFYLKDFMLYDDDYFDAAFYLNAFSGYLMKKLTNNKIAFAYYNVAEEE